MFKMSHWIWEGSFWRGLDSRDFSTATGPYDHFFTWRTSKELPQVVGVYKPHFSSAADSSDIFLAVHKDFPSDRMKFGLETRVQIAVSSNFTICSLSSVQFSRSVVSNTLRPHGLQHARPPYLSPTPGVYPNWVGDAIQPFHPLSSASPPSFSLCQHQGLFQWLSSSHQVAEVLELQLQHHSFQWIFKTDFL